jgi:glycosyltransferase involved in cell wall biosynthesis
VEGFGYVLAEAMAAGKPCAAYAASSTPEVVLDGTTGLLAPEGDDAQLARCIARLLDDPQLCADLGRAGRLHVETNLTLARMIDGLEQELVRLADRGRGS